MKVVKSDFALAAIPAGFSGDRVKFDPQNTLNKVAIKAISVSSTALSNKSFDGQPLLNASAFKSAYLVLVDPNNVEIIKLPLVAIEERPESNKRFFELSDVRADISKSYIRFGDTSAINSGTTEVLQFVVYY